MGCVIRCVVELAVLHATASAHTLHIARGNAFDIAHAVFVRQVASQDVADDFHVAMAMRAEAGARGNAVFIDHAQIAPAHVLRVVVARKRKTVKRLEPAMVGIAAVGGFAYSQHSVFAFQ